MFRCKNCGSIFEEPVGFYDNVPYGEGSVECCTGSGSPCCGDSYEEVDMCACGEVAFKHHLCKNCYNEVYAKIVDLQKKESEICKEYDITDYDLEGVIEDVTLNETF